MAVGESGRNDPCPCGSGRKYKHCCLTRAGEGIRAAGRLGMSYSRIIDGVLRFAEHTWGDTLLEHGWDDFWNYNGPDDIGDEPETDTMFFPWFAFEFVPDPHSENLDPDWPTTPMAQAWGERSPDITPEERRLIDLACRSPFSAWVVEAVAPGRHLDVKDILTGVHRRVVDEMASRSLSAADLWFTRVLTMDGVSIAFGSAPYVVPPAWHLEVIEWRQGVRPRRLMTRDEVADFDTEIRDLYFEITERMLNQGPPRLRNTDGDDLVLTTLTYRVTESVERIVERLAALATIDGDDHTTVTTEGAEVTSAAMPWLKKPRGPSGGDAIGLAQFRVEPGVLTVEVNSAERAEKVKREIARRLKGAELVDTAVTMPEELLRREDGTNARVRERRPPAQTAEMDEGERLMRAEFMRRHMEGWVDERVPALGNKTPRQAAKTALGRERVEALLSEFERRDVNDGDVLAWVRRELGLG